jgi:hypothetical protein
MKNDDLEILLEGLAGDLSAVLKKLNGANAGGAYPDMAPLHLELKKINTELQTLNAQGRQPTTSTEAIVDQQRLIDFKIQLDRIALKLSREDNLIDYYFSPFKTFLKTITLLFFAIFLGMILDRLYLNYQIKQANKIESNESGY